MQVRRRNRKSPSLPDPEKHQSLSDLMQSLNLSWRGTDLVLVGDGSGTGGWTKGCGWSVLVYEKSNRPFFLCGGMNVGSLNFAELFPYVHAVAWFDQARDGYKIRKEGKLCQVVVLSDNMEVVTTGNALMTGEKTWTELAPHRFDWEAFRFFVRRGYAFKFVWIPRDTVKEHVVADNLSRQSRIVVEQVSSIDGNTEAIEERGKGRRQMKRAYQYQRKIVLNEGIQ